MVSLTSEMVILNRGSKKKDSSSKVIRFFQVKNKSSKIYFLYLDFTELNHHEDCNCVDVFCCICNGFAKTPKSTWHHRCQLPQLSFLRSISIWPGNKSDLNFRSPESHSAYIFFPRLPDLSNTQKPNANWLLSNSNKLPHLHLPALSDHLELLDHPE